MSLDLAWNELDSTLATRLVDALNRQLSNVERPSFIRPVQITGFEFGTICPDVEVVDMRDIYRDFLEDDEEDEEGRRRSLHSSGLALTCYCSCRREGRNRGSHRDEPHQSSSSNLLDHHECPEL